MILIYNVFFQNNFRPISHAYLDAVLVTCSQRLSNLAQAGGTIQFMRATNVHIPTAFSAALHPRLRQTASCVQSFLSVIHCFYFMFNDLCFMSGAF